MNPHPVDLQRLHATRLAELYRTDFFSFVWQVFMILNGVRGKAFIPNWHVEAIAYQLQRVAEGDLTRLLILLPPRHLKTICSLVALPAWLLGKDPGHRIIATGYGQELSGKSLRDLVRVLDSTFYRALFPETRLLPGRSGTLYTSKGGYYMPTSVGGAVTGFGADTIIIDDVMKALEASSQAMRQEAKDYYERSLATRLDDKKTGRIIAVQQRLHEDDLPAHLMAKGTFEVLSLPAIAVEDETIQIGPDRFHHRRKDDVLFPQSEPKDVLDKMRRDMGAAAFSTQYQQNPVAPGGNRINWSHWGTYADRLDRHEYILVVQSWDTGTTSEPTSDYSACSTWGLCKDGRTWHLLNVFRERMEYSTLRETVIRMRKRWNADRVLIEHAMTGIPLIRELWRERGLFGVVHRYDPRFDKMTRFNSQTSKLEDGAFHLPTDAAWLADFRNECLAFPNGKHDDMVDSMSQFLDWLGYRSGLGTVGRFRRESDRRR